MGSMSWVHWVIVLVVVILVFGTKRLKSAGKDLGEAVKGFKQGMGDDDKGPPGQLGDDSRTDESRIDPQRSEQPRTDTDREQR